MQQPRLHRDADRRQRDAVAFAEIGQGLDLRVDRNQFIGEVTERGDAAHVLPAARPVPDGEQGADARGGDVDRAGEQRVVRVGAARERDELRLDVDAERSAVLFDQLAFLYHVEQQVDEAELLGDPESAFGMRQRPGHGQGSTHQQHAQALQCGLRRQPTRRRSPGGTEACLERKRSTPEDRGAVHQNGTSPSIVVRFRRRRM